MFSRPTASLAAGALLLRTSIAGYALTDSYAQSTFFGNFTAFTGPDPTSGFVQFTDYNAAITTGLIGTVTNNNNSTYLGVDSSSKPPTGRASVRIESKKSFNKGLFIADISHMPVGCGSWPAFWLLGKAEWPAGGEIDIIEGVNPASDAPSTNQMTLHTSSNCKIQPSAPSIAKPNTTNCDVNATDQPKNHGCAYESADPATFGTGFNAAGGGVYATQLTSSFINIYFFPRSKIPADITSNTPDPSKWGTPTSSFVGGQGFCDIDSHFKDMRIIFDTTFCGQWAGEKSVWGQSSCGKKAETCEAYVKENPQAFKDAYWLVNSVKVFQDGNGGAAASQAKKTMAKREGFRFARGE